jgi:TonB family protein
MTVAKTQMLLLLLITQLYAQGQDTTITYYDMLWNECKVERAVFFGKHYVDGNNIPHADDYYISGQIQMTGTYLKKNYRKKNGLFTWYYKNGQPEYSGNYLKGERVGEWTWWSDSGMVEQKEVYNEKGLRDGPAAYWFENGQMDCEGSFTDGAMDGVWKFYHENGQECSRETYVMGELVALEMWNESGEPEKVKELSTETEPEYPGGFDSMADFIRTNVVYPEEARGQMIQGSVYVEFIVGRTGEIENVKVLKSAHPLLDEEALRVVKLMPAWIPGRQHNRAVRVRYTIPINFKIQ